MLRVILPFLLCIFVAGCLPTPPGQEASAANEMIVETDRFTGDRTVRTPFYLSRQGFTDTFPVRLSLSATVNSSPPRNALLIVRTTGTDWGFYNSARGEDQYRFSFTELDRRVDSGGGIVTTEEWFGLAIPIAQLTRMSAANYEIEVRGSRNSGVFVVPATVVRAFLAEIGA